MLNRLLSRSAIGALLVLAGLVGSSGAAGAQTVIATVSVGMTPLRVAVNPSTNRVYVTDNGSNVLSVIDGNSDAVIATTPVGAKPVGVAANQSTNRIYVANQGNSSVSVIDGTSNAVIATIGVGTNPTEIAVNPNTNRVYVGNGLSNSVSVIDGGSNAVVATIPFASSPAGIAVNSTTNRVYVITTGAAGKLSVLDGGTNNVIATIASGSNSSGVAVNPATNRVYVTNTMNGTVAVIDGNTNAVITNVSTGSVPVGTFGVAVNPTINHVYATNLQAGAAHAVVIDGASNTVTATLPMGGGAEGVAANSATNRVYVTNDRGNSVSVIQDPSPAPPPVTPTSTWFFAEGSTQPPFDTWFLVQNPNPVAANVSFTFEIQGGGIITRGFVVGPTSRFSLFVNQVIANVAFSTRIDADQPIFAERSMFVSFDGTVVTGIPSPDRTWLFAEGSTQNPFQTWLLLQNPNNQSAIATVTYLLLGGGTPVTQTLSLPPTSRTSIFVNQVLPNAAFSSRIDSDLPIVAERSMFRFPGNAATANPGVNSPSSSWFFADGNTTQGASPFDSFLLLENPNNSPAMATVNLFHNGSVVTFTQQLAAQSRQSVFLNQVLSNARFGIQVTATQPIIAERSEFFNPEPRGAISTQGATALASTWFLPEGSTQTPFTELITILNPTSSNMSAHIDFDLPTGQVIGRDFLISPNREFVLNVNNVIPNSPVSARVSTSQPSVVERILFFNKLGSLGGTDTIGISR